MNISEIPAGEAWDGKIEGFNVVIYNDNGNFVFLENVCTHLGCQTHFNKEEKTWDCPCHGSRYHLDGSVLRGPAKRALSPINYLIENGQIRIKRAV